MGALPLGYLLTIAVPRTTPEAWFEAFAAGLAADQAEFGLKLLGGDSTSTPGPVTVSLTILGTAHAVLRRDGRARGRRYLGLRHDRRRGARAAGAERRGGRPRRLPGGPLPPAAATAGARAAAGRHRACRHGCLGRAGAGPRPSVPRRRPRRRGRGSIWFPPRWRRARRGRAISRAGLTGGDDYELLFAAAASAASAVRAAAAACGTPVMRDRALPRHAGKCDGARRTGQRDRPRTGRVESFRRG